MTILRKPLTKSEIRLFKECVINEYKLRTIKNTKVDEFFRKLKTLAPFNIVIGIIAAALVVKYYGWNTLGYMALFSVIWLTLISSVASLFIKTK